VSLSVFGGATTTDPPLVINPVRDVERSKTGLIQIGRKLIELIEVVVRVEKGALLIVAIAIAHDLVRIIHGASVAPFVESGQNS
jgi:hypothetical protein